MTAPARLTRRLALGVLGAAAVAVLAVRELRLLPRHHFRKSPYDDLLAALPDRETAAQFGRSALGSSFHPAVAAAQLRQEMQGQSLQNLSYGDAKKGRVLELANWVVPQSLGLLCILAAAEA